MSNDNKHVIPASLMRMLDSEDIVDNREAIIHYYISESGTVELSSKQQKLRDRWEVADQLMRSRRYSTGAVVNLLCKKFDISRATARRDIADAQYVFGTRDKPNKDYLLAVHIDDIRDACKLAQQQNSKLLPLLFRELTAAIKALPADEQSNPTPAAIVFNVPEMNITISDDDAKAKAKEMLKKQGITIDLDDDEYQVET